MKAIYARQSLDKKDSLSIETQIDDCVRYLKKNEDYKVYEDKGFSGKDTERPALTEMFNDIRQGKVDTILVYRLDRFSRNIIDFYKMHEIMKAHKCEFVSVTEKFDTTTSMGRAMMSILITFAQMERENIQQRVKDNYYYRTATTGSWAGGPAPFGFSNGRTPEGKPTLIVNEDEMKIVKLIFKRYSQEINMSLGKVAKYLMDNGYRSRRKNGSWDSSSVSKILQSTVYVKADNVLYKYLQIRQIKFLNDEKDWDGKTSCHIIGKRVGNANIRKYADFKEQSVYLTNFPGVISSRDYISIMKRLGENQQITSSNKAGVLQELGGKLKCSCGYAIKSYSKSTNGRPYLDCYANRSLHTCNHKYNKFDFYDIQASVGAEIQKQLDTINETMAHKRQVRKDKRKQIEELAERLNVLLEMSSTSDLMLQATIKQIEKIQRQINELELDIQMNTDILDEIAINHFTEPMFYMGGTDEFSLDYSSLSVDEKKYVVNRFIDKIILDEETETIHINWKI